MRILYVVTSLEVGGIERNLIRLARELIGRGHRITVVSSGGELVRDLEAAGGEHVRAQVTWRSPGGLISAALRVRTLVSGDSVDIVHAMSASASVATYLARRTPRPWSYITSPMGLEGSDREPRTITWLRNAVNHCLTHWSPAVLKCWRCAVATRPEGCLKLIRWFR